MSKSSFACICVCVHVRQRLCLIHHHHKQQQHQAKFYARALAEKALLHSSSPVTRISSSHNDATTTQQSRATAGRPAPDQTDRAEVQVHILVAHIERNGAPACFEPSEPNPSRIVLCVLFSFITSSYVFLLAIASRRRLHI